MSCRNLNRKESTATTAKQRFGSSSQKSKCSVVLLPNEHNKLLTQWKGPFDASAIVGLNNYKVKVEGKERLYHANLLEKHFESDELAELSAAAVKTGETAKDKDPGGRREADETEGGSDLLEIGGYVPQESIHDITTGPILQKNKEVNLWTWRNRFEVRSLKHTAPLTWFSTI